MTPTKEQIDEYVSYAREDCIGEAMGVIVALADQRDELVALLNDTTVHGGTCDGIDSEDDTVCLSADDPLYHECTDVDEHQATPCWGHQVRRMLAHIGGTK